ncbi:MAG: hypothetical protein ACR2QU_01655 [Gammaproteobacteria bacterium]
MTNKINKVLITLVAMLACASNAYAGCTNPKFFGAWDVQFSDGTSCRLVLGRGGEVLADKSVCYDPSRGATAPDSGSYAVVPKDCEISASVVVQGVTIDLEGVFAIDRNTGHGRFLVPAFAVMGGYSMIRMP